MKKHSTPSNFPKLFLLLLCCALHPFNTKAQNPDKIKLGIKAAWLYSNPVTIKSVPSQVTLGGYDPRMGYDVSVFAQKKCWKNIHLLGQVGHSLQGRRWEGVNYHHYLAYAEIGANLKLFTPVHVEAGLRGGGVIATNDPFEDRMKKGDLGYRLGLNFRLTPRIGLHLDYLRSFTPFAKTSLPSGDFSVFRQNFGAGLSYIF